MSREHMHWPPTSEPYPETGSTALDGRAHPKECGRTVLRIARLSCEGQVGLCIVRNISPQSLTLEVPGELKLEGPVEIDMGRPRALKGQLQWRDGLSAGIRLLEPIDIDQVLEKHEVDAKGKTVRSPRVAIVFPAEIEAGSAWHHVEVLDISVGGAKLALAQQLAVGQRLRLRLPTHDPIPGVVRWSGNGELGIGFDKPVRIGWLMNWLSSRRNGSAAPGATRLQGPA